MKIEEVLNADCIYLNKDLHNKSEVFEFLSTSLYKAGFISNKDAFLEKVYYREKLSITGLVEGIAIPHGVSNTVKTPSVAFVRTNEEIEWESIDGKKVRYIFMLAIPENSKDDIHIKMISELARSLIDEKTIEKLKCVKTAEELLSLLKKGGKK